MSTYEWERGSIKLPVKAFGQVLTAIQDADRAEKLKIFDLANRAYLALVAAGKGKRGFDYAHALLDTDPFRAYQDQEDADDIMRLLFPRDAQTGVRTKKPRTPKKNALDLPTGRTLSFSVGEASITFNREAHTVVWDVPENNHAREYARGLALGRAFFRALDQVEWVRGSGGKLLGNDEYSREGGEDEEGGGGSYVTQEFGVNVQRAARRTANTFHSPLNRRFY